MTGAWGVQVEVRDPLTGVPVFNYKQKDHTVTSSRGHGHVDKKVLLERKKTKLVRASRSCGWSVPEDAGS